MMFKVILDSTLYDYEERQYTSKLQAIKKFKDLKNKHIEEDLFNTQSNYTHTLLLREVELNHRGVVNKFKTLSIFHKEKKEV